MSVFTAKDVAIAFNSVISDLMSKGYVISPFTNNGTYSKATSYIDLFNPNDSSHILRVWMIDDYVQMGDRYWHRMDVTGPRVKKYIKGTSFNGDLSKGHTLWPDYGETVCEKLFYMFKETKNNKVYSDDLEEAKKLRQMSFDRQMSRPSSNPFKDDRVIPNDKLPSKFIDSIMHRINSVRGFKRATATCIESVCLDNRFAKLCASVKFRFNDKVGIIKLK